MPKRKYITYPDIGKVLYVKSTKARRVTIAVKSPKSVRVAVPKLISFKRAESFVIDKFAWIIRQQSKMRNKINVAEAAKLANTNDKIKLIERVEYLARTNGFKYNKLTFKNMRTRWGSCSPQNNISLNVALISLPHQLSDYVILHELVHTKIKNHSFEFWQELGKVIYDPKLLNKTLSKQYGLYKA